MLEFMQNVNMSDSYQYTVILSELLTLDVVQPLSVVMAINAQNITSAWHKNRRQKLCDS